MALISLDILSKTEDWDQLETSITSLLLDGKKYYASLEHDEPSEEVIKSEDYLVINCEYQLVGPVLLNLQEKHENFKVQTVTIFDNITFKWVIISQDSSSENAD